MRTLLRLAAFAAVIATPLHAQTGTWRAWVAGSGDAGTMEQMPPGWHLTTGPQTLWYEPTTTASGRYRVESLAFVFPGAATSFLGVLVGGNGLGTATPSGVVCLLRRDGMVAIHQLDQGAHRVLIDWTPAASAVRPAGEEPGKNLFSVSVEADSLRFQLNGAPVAALPAAALRLDGQVALLAGPQLSAHVATLDIVHPHAPRAAGR